MELQYHPIAEMFPALPPDELRELANDIASKGLLQPVVLYEGMILDGRHRYQACLTENIAPIFKDFDGEDPVSFVISMNLHRRHLTTAQRKHLAKEILKRSPERTDRWVARDTGLSHPTVAKVREEVEETANGKNFHHAENDRDSSGPGSSIEPAPPVAEEPTGLSGSAPPATPTPRVQSTGRRAGGRQPLSAKERKAKEQRPVRPTPLSNPREDRIETVSAWLRTNVVGAMEDIGQIIDGYTGMINIKMTGFARREWIQKRAKALGFNVEI